METSPAQRDGLWTLIGLLLLLLVGAGAFALVNIDRLATLSDDSVSYMLLGQCWSPWGEVSDAVREACRKEHYPPLFPLLLAGTGAGNSFLWAHRLYVALFLLDAVLLYLFVRRQTGAAPLALGTALWFAVAPLNWTNLLGITSETLFMCLTLLALLHQESLIRKERPTWRDGVLLGLLLGGALLTRAIGVSLVGAALAAAFFMERRRLLPLGLVPSGVAALVAGAGYALRALEGNDLYSHDLKTLLGHFLAVGVDPAAWLAFFTPQAKQILSAWMGFFTLHWESWASPRFLLGALFGLAALAGLFHRLRLNRMDAWFALFNLGILMLWFIPGQFPRFVFALGPVLLFHAVWGIRLVTNHLPETRQARLLLAFLVCLPLALSLPALGFFHQRAQYRSPYPGLDPAANAEFYRDPDFDDALEKALLQESLFQDMERMRATTPPEARILWFTPSYLALLANRRGIFLNARFDNGRTPSSVTSTATTPDYLFITKLHPRDTRSHVNGMVLLPRFQSMGTPLWGTDNPRNPGEPFSRLIRFDPAKIVPNRNGIQSR